MYYNIITDGKTEVFKSVYKVCPIVKRDGEYMTMPNESAVDGFLFEKYEDCFNFLNDFFENRDIFFDPNGYGWKEEDWEGFDHFDIINVVLKTNEKNQDGTYKIVLLETVANVTKIDKYPYAPEEDKCCEIPGEKPIDIKNVIEQLDQIRKVLLEMKNDNED